jgi:DNA invertase Pin-like site-specific DNA recombinase
VSRQLAECRDLCERNGWVVEEIYQDNDKSATSGKPRPEWTRLLRDLKAGRFDVLVCWHTDRLYRRLRDLVDLVEIAENRSLKIATVKASDLDLSTPAGRMVASLLGSVAAYEGQQKAARQVAANRQRAQRGVVLWTRRPFGFDRDGDRVFVVETEAQHLRKAAQQVLNGATLTSIADAWNDRGLVTTVGKPWNVTSVRRALLNPRTAGRVTSKGEDFGPAAHGILEPDVADAVGAILRDPARESAPPSTDVKYLLSGLAVCGRDGETMYAAPTNGGVMAYRCTRCYLARRLDLVDEVLMGVLVERLSRPDAAGLLEPDVDLDEIRRRLADLRERRDGLAQLLAEGLLTAEAVRVQAEKLTAEIDAQELAQRAVTGSTPLARVVGTVDVLEALGRLALRDVRAIIATLMTVRILPAGKGVRFDPDQVAIEWKSA